MRIAALLLLKEMGLAEALGDDADREIERLVAGVSFARWPALFVHLHFPETDALAGANILMAVSCALLEGSRGRDCDAAVDVEAATCVAFA